MKVAKYVVLICAAYLFLMSVLVYVLFNSWVNPVPVFVDGVAYPRWTGVNYKQDIYETTSEFALLYFPTMLGLYTLLSYRKRICEAVSFWKAFKYALLIALVPAVVSSAILLINVVTGWCRQYTCTELGLLILPPLWFLSVFVLATLLRMVCRMCHERFSFVGMFTRLRASFMHTYDKWSFTALIVLLILTSILALFHVHTFWFVY